MLYECPLILDLIFFFLKKQWKYYNMLHLLIIELIIRIIRRTKSFQVALKFFIIDFITFSLFYFKFFLLSYFYFYLLFLSNAPSSILLSSFSSTSATLGFGSSLAQRIVRISLLSSD